LARQNSSGLRVLLGLAGLFLLIVSAWYAQDQLVGKLQQDQRRSGDLLSEGAEAPPEEAGWGHVILGAPSGAKPIKRLEAAQPVPAPVDLAIDSPPVREDEPQVGPAPVQPRWPADLELVVRPGQSLSKIAAAEYGRATDELVHLLAAYNGLADPNKLRAGQALRVPVKEKLLAGE